MNSRDKHVGRTQKEKEHYIRGLKNIPCGSTDDAEIRLPSSDKPEKDLSIQKSTKHRKTKTSERISDSLREHYISWILGFIGAAIIFFLSTFSRSLGNLEGKVSEIKELLSNINSKYDKVIEKNHNQDLKMQESSLKIKEIEKKID